MDNVGEMDKFLEKYNFPKLNQEGIENLNRPITSIEIKIAIKNLKKKVKNTKQKKTKSSNKQKPRIRRIHR